MENHLIIGLGGTGGRIIRSIKAIIEQNHGNNPPREINIDYLYLDTSNDDTDGALKWKEKTTSTALTPANIVKLDKTPLNSYLNNIDAYHTIKPWIGSAAEWGEVVPAGEVAAGQKRKYGRFLLACEVGKFVNSLNAIVRSLIEKTPDKVRNITFHVCCGLAGGTGSGTIVDVVTQIRKIFPFDDNNFFNAIYLYTLLPELTPTTWDAGTYHANGYAALKELNELSFLKYKPYDLTDQSKRELRIGGDPNIPSPHVLFNGCYVFTNENEKDVQLNVSKDIPELVGSYIYKKTFSINNPAAKEFINKLARCENGNSDPEEDSNQHGKPLRGKRFLTFGIKRIGIPEVEIKSHFAASFAEQTTKQLLYNSWFDTQGYTDEAKQKQFNQYVAASENIERWLLSDQHLTLSKLILPADIQRPWTTFVSSWEKKRNEFSEIVTNSAIVKSNWIIELKKKYDLFFTETFRGEGVARFFMLKEKDIKDTVRFVIDNIDRDLFDQWRNANFGLVEIGYLINDLIAYLESKRNNVVNERITKLQNDELQYKSAIETEDKSWDSTGTFSDMVFNDKKKSFERQNQNLELLFRTRTQLRGWEYAKKLLPEIISGLSELNKKIAQIQSDLITLREKNGKIIKTTCQDTHPQISDYFVKFYDSKNVRAKAKALTVINAVQSQQATVFRNEIVSSLEGQNTFSQFDRKLPVSALEDLLERHIDNTVVTINKQIKDITDDGKKVFDVSITERLREEYENNREGLKELVRGLVNQAAVFVKYNGVQENLDPDSHRKNEFFVIMPPDARPEGTNTNTFNHILKEAFQTSRNPGIADENIIYTEPRSTEITLLNIHNLFPLRFLTASQQLRAKYYQTINNPDKSIARKAKVTLHTEGDSTTFADLFIVERNKKDYLPYVCLADNLGIIQQQPNPQTEELEYLILPEDVLTGEVIVLGKNLLMDYQKSSFAELDGVKERIEKMLKSDYVAISKKSALKDSITNKLRAFLAEKNNNIRDADFILYKEASNAAIALI